MDRIIVDTGTHTHNNALSYISEFLQEQYPDFKYTIEVEYLFTGDYVDMEVFIETHDTEILTMLSLQVNWVATLNEMHNRRCRGPI